MPYPNDNPEPGRPANAGYGADWVGLDGPAMRVRRDRQREKEIDALHQEAERQKLAEEQLQEFMASRLEDRPEPSGRPPVEPPAAKDRARQKTKAHPSALVDALRIENLRSFGGRHEIPLAPLTLIYGPNSAGKSTLIKGLKTFLNVVDAGRHDALNAWRSSRAP